jgi:hypothetical protein
MAVPRLPGSLQIPARACVIAACVHGFHSALTTPHVRIRHHRGAIRKKTSLRGQHSVQKLEIFQRTARSKTIYFKCRCSGGRAKGHRKRFGMPTHPLVCFISLTPIQPGSSKDVLFLTADEELLLVRHYLTKVVQLCGHFRFPEEVEATATTYIKRFYLTNTVMDWHPKNVMCGQSNVFSVLFTWLTRISSWRTG